MFTKLIYPFYKWLLVVPFFLTWTVVMFVLVVLVCLYDAELAGRTIARTWARVNYRITLATLRVRGGENLVPGQGYVIVANHLSQFDILVLYGWLRLDLKWVMKKELRSMPVIGAAGQVMGHVFLDRSNHTAAVRSLQEVRKKLKSGVSMLFFAEGTRSRDGRLKPFKKGAFATACNLGLPILPVSLIDTDRILPPDGFHLRPGSAEMVIHPPIPAAKVIASTPDELLACTRAIIASALPREQLVTAGDAEVTCIPE